jgi:hypothetical protein
MTNNILDTLKKNLANSLIKQGSSLDELEQELSNKTLTEKSAAGLFDMLHTLGKDGLSAAWEVAKTAPEALATAGILGGTALGGGAYMLDKHLGNQDKKHDQKQQLIDKYKELTERVKGDHGLHLPLTPPIQNPY